MSWNGKKVVVNPTMDTAIGLADIQVMSCVFENCYLPTAFDDKIYVTCFLPFFCAADGTDVSDDTHVNVLKCSWESVPDGALYILNHKFWNFLNQCK